IAENSIRLLIMLFTMSAMPMLATVWEKQGEEASRRLVSSVTRLYLLIGIPAVTAMCVLAKPLVSLLIGAEFSGAYAIVPWIMTGAFFLGLQQRFNQVLLLVQRSWI